MRNVWIDVDTQHDFCDPSGALFVRGAETKISLFQQLVQRAVSAGEPIVGSVDTHAFDAWEFAGAPSKGPNGETPNFPPHCVKGTAGQLKVPGTLAPRVRFIPNVEVEQEALRALVTKNAPQQILVEKEVYSLFANPNADAILSMVTKADEATRYIVFGVALDYCVKAAALGLVDYLARTNRSGEVVLLTDATASVVEQGGELALEACRAAGGRLAKVSELSLTLRGSWIAITTFELLSPRIAPVC
ncbi:MAG: cysteine hydrolase family protein [Polyangiaceae bacterium]